MADNKNASFWMICQAAYGIGLAFVREVDFLDGFLEAEIPKLQAVILFHADDEISKRNTLRHRTLFAEKHERCRPHLLILHVGSKHQDRIADKFVILVLVSGIKFGFGQAADVPEFD